MENQYSKFPVPEFASGLTVDAAAQHRVVVQELQLNPFDSDVLSLDPQLLLQHVRKLTQQPERIADLLTSLETMDQPQHVAQHAVLLGEPGDGKSTLLHKLCLSILRQENNALFLSARDFEGFSSLEEFITKGKYLIDTGVASEWGTYLWNQFQAGHVPLFIDALDQAGDCSTIAKRILRIASGAGSKAIIVVTCRKAVYRNLLPSFLILELFPLGKEEIHTYAKAALQAHTEAFMNMLQEDARTMALAGSGFMLAMIAHFSMKPGFRPPVARDDMYDEIVNKFLDQGIYPSELHAQILERIAFHKFFCQNLRSDILGWQLRACINQVLKDARWQQYRNEDIKVFSDIVQQVGLLNSNPTGTYSFFHPTIQEYFAARFLVNHWETMDTSYIKWLPCDPDWQIPTRELFCSSCECTVPSFYELILQPQYQEVLLLFVGMLRRESLEKLLLNGMAYDRTYVKGSHPKLLFWFDFDEEHNLRPEWLETQSFVERHIIADNAQYHLSFVLACISRCHYVHENHIKNALNGLEAVAWRRNYDEAIRTLGRSRETGNASIAVEFCIERLGDSFAPTRQVALSSLGNLGRKALTAVPHIAQRLNDVDLRVRLAAVEALDKLSQHDTSIASLLEGISFDSTKIGKDFEDDLTELETMRTEMLSQFGEDALISNLIDFAENLQQDTAIRRKAVHLLIILRNKSSYG